jgi:hypothetical protein
MGDDRIKIKWPFPMDFQITSATITTSLTLCQKIPFFGHFGLWPLRIWAHPKGSQRGFCES